MLNKINEVLEAFQIQDTSRLNIKVGRNGKDELIIFSYPMLVKTAIWCLWEINNTKEILRTQELPKHYVYTDLREAKQGFFRAALKYYKEFLPLYHEWKEKNFPNGVY